MPALTRRSGACSNGTDDCVARWSEAPEGDGSRHAGGRLAQVRDGLGTFFPCTNAGGATGWFGFEVFGPDGISRNDPSATSLDLAPGEIVLFGTSLSRSEKGASVKSPGDEPPRATKPPNWRRIRLATVDVSRDLARDAPGLRDDLRAFVAAE